MTDITDNIGTLVFTKIWTGPHPTAADSVAHATVVGIDTVFDVGDGLTLTVKGDTDPSIFSDDIALLLRRKPALDAFPRLIRSVRHLSLFESAVTNNPRTIIALQQSVSVRRQATLPLALPPTADARLAPIGRSVAGRRAARRSNRRAG